MKLLPGWKRIVDQHELFRKMDDVWKGDVRLRNVQNVPVRKQSHVSCTYVVLHLMDIFFPKTRTCNQSFGHGSKFAASQRKVETTVVKLSLTRIFQGIWKPPALDLINPQAEGL